MPQIIKGWADGGIHVFCLAFAVYMLTVGPAVSLWDSGEFVCCAAGLDVGHPPGAPLYWLLLRLAVILFPSGCEALACSVVSALCSAVAATLLSLIFRQGLLWWAELKPGFHVSRLALCVGQTAAGLSWALADSVWAISVETEVYGAASALGFAILWLSMLWRRRVSCHSAPGALIPLILFLVGISAGVHWLGWLTLPLAAAVVASPRGRWPMLIASLAGCLAVVLLTWFASGHLFDFALLLDVAAVNIFSLPVGVGWCIGALILPIALLCVALFVRNNIVGQLSGALFLLTLGFVSAVVPFLRADGAAISICSPSDAQRISDYLSRRQYGSRPLVYGPTYASRPDGLTSEARMDLDPESRRYVAREVPVDYSYPSSQLSFMPRMTSQSPQALWAYNVWAHPDAWPDSIPSFAANFRFLISYQMGHMMARYVLWNFCGRQNGDIGDGGYLSGNFILGIEPLDEARLHMVAYDSPAQGRYALFGIPLILAVVGLVLIVRKSPVRLSALFLLWVAIAGPCLAFYLNMPPYEPRERDYVFLFLYAALFLAAAVALFAIFIKLRNVRWAKFPSAVILALGLPTLMLAQGWASHNRSGDTIVDDLATSILNLCPPDAVIVVGGDNDTYPLWYAQQVLGHRRDVRVVNIGLLGADWYAAQLQRAGRADAPLRMTHGDLASRGQLQSLWLLPTATDTLPLSDVRPAANTSLGQSFYLPASRIALPLRDTTVVLNVQKESLDPAELLLLEIASDNPNRPLCLMPDVLSTSDLGLSPYVKSLGPISFLVPDTSIFSPLHIWQLFRGAVHLPDASTFTPSPDEVSQLTRLGFRHFANTVAADAIDRSDVQSAFQALHSSLTWQPAGLGDLDPELIQSAILLHRSGDLFLARSILTSLASRCSLQLRRAQALSSHAPSTARSLVDSLSPFTLSLIEALQSTGNTDVALSLANLISSLPVAG